MLAVAGVLAIAASLAWDVADAAAQQEPLRAGTVWVNQLGSTMTIQVVAANGLVTGTYATKVGCGAGKVRPLIGWYNKGAFAFVVNWEECESLTAWSGHVDSLNPKIVTLWHLPKSGPPRWDSTFAGADTFVPK